MATFARRPVRQSCRRSSRWGLGHLPPADPSKSEQDSAAPADQTVTSEKGSKPGGARLRQARGTTCSVSRRSEQVHWDAAGGRPRHHPSLGGTGSPRPGPVRAAPGISCHLAVCFQVHVPACVSSAASISWLTFLVWGSWKWAAQGQSGRALNPVPSGCSGWTGSESSRDGRPTSQQGSRDSGGLPGFWSGLHPKTFSCVLLLCTKGLSRNI